MNLLGIIASKARQISQRISAFPLCNAWVERILFAVLLLAVCLLPYPDLAPTQELHGFLSSHGLTLAAHLSPEHHFLMYNRIVVDSAGVDHYEAYNRFSIAPFLLIRGAMELGGNDLFAQVTAARKLMLLFWLGAMFCAYLTFRRLGRRPLVAATVVMLAFSTRFFLRYNDMVFNDVPALFGCMLLFHGLILHWQENRPRQLLVKALIAVALGWQAYAMLFPSVALLQWKNRRTKENLLLAAAPLFLGIALLTFNLANECVATHKPLLETSTAQSIAYRFGVASDEEYAPLAVELKPSYFLREQGHRLGVSMIPPLVEEVVSALNYSVFLRFGVWLSPFGPYDWIWGVLALALALCALWRGWVPRFPAFCLVALALCWTFPMKHFTFQHDFQAIFLVGIPLVLFDGLLHRLPDKSRISPLLAVAATATLLFSEINLCASKVSEQADAHGRLVTLQGIADALQAENHPVIYVERNAVEKIGGAGQTLGFTLPEARFTHDERAAQWRLLDNPVRIELVPH